MTREIAIEVADLSLRYADGREALRGLRFQVGVNESIGLIGPNGAGKTSLFLCLVGVLTPTAGTIRVAGLDVRNASQRKSLPAHVGIVFQDSDDQLFCANLRDDVAFGPLNLRLPAEEVRQRVTQSLAEVGLAGYEDRVPQQLSGGEKRRAALAGVLAMRPSVLLLDEPSMFLDPRGRRELIALLGQLSGTKVIASHDLEFIVQSCERVLLLDQGKIAAEGRTREVLGNAQLMEQHGLEVPWSLRVSQE